MNEKAKEILNRLLDSCIKQNAEKLAEIALSGNVAVVVFEPSRSAQEALRSGLQWSGETVFALRRKDRKRFAANLKEMGDIAANRWLLRPMNINPSGRVARILVFIHGGTLCVNFTPDGGYSIEPGTLDEERLATFH